jgi:choline-sulfatase
VLASLPALLLGPSACTEPSSTRTPSVLLITVDTLRADRVGAYRARGAEPSALTEGDPAAAAPSLTPNLDAVADGGAVFLRAYSSSPQTIPSHATLLTGRYPPSHGVLDNGDFALGPEQVTLAERFRGAGYWTVGVSASFATRSLWGFDQGFDQYLQPATPGEAGSHADQRPANEAVDAAVQAIRAADPRKPMFLWVHLFDPQYPYDPPEPWRSRTRGRPYDGEVAFVDAEIGRLLSYWEDKYAVADSIVAITAPQGESLGEGEEQTHGVLLHDATLRVPLIVRGPGMTPGGRSTDPVGLVDLAPTLLDLSHVGLHDGLQGGDLRLGGSVTIYSESQSATRNLGLAPLYALTEEGGRLVHGAWSGWYPVDGLTIRAEGERVDPDSREVRALEQVRAPLDPQTLAMVSALGYVGGASLAEPNASDPRDVAELLPLVGRARRMIDIGMQLEARDLLGTLEDRLPRAYGVQLMQAQLLYRQGRLAEADRAYRVLYWTAPSATAALQLATLAVARGRWTEALDWYDEAYQLDTSCLEAMAGRARAAYLLGDRRRAYAYHADMLDQDPNDPHTRLVGAELGLYDLPPSLLLEDAQAAVRALPWSAWAYALYGRVLWELGDADAAIDALQEALRLDPYPAPVRIELVSNLLEMGRAAEAVRVSAPLARMLADHPAAQEVYRLARESLTSNEYAQLMRARARSQITRSRRK